MTIPTVALVSVFFARKGLAVEDPSGFNKCVSIVMLHLSVSYPLVGATETTWTV